MVFVFAQSAAELDAAREKKKDCGSAERGAIIAHRFFGNSEGKIGSRLWALGSRLWLWVAVDHFTASFAGDSKVQIGGCRVTAGTGSPEPIGSIARQDYHMSGTFEDLHAWRLAMDLAEEVYRCTQSFPKAELYGLTDQMRRSAVSIPSNIAEGKGRSSDRELVQFVNHAGGSLYELQTQINLAARLSYIESEPAIKIASHAEDAGKVLNGLIRSFRRTPRLEADCRPWNQKPKA